MDMGKGMIAMISDDLSEVWLESWTESICMYNVGYNGVSD